VRVYHNCGYPLWVETHEHERTHATTYRDDDDQSDTYGEEVAHCPGCNAWLAEDTVHAERQGEP
jgi:hypothetical protein